MTVLVKIGLIHGVLRSELRVAGQRLDHSDVFFI